MRMDAHHNQRLIKIPGNSVQAAIDEAEQVIFDSDDEMVQHSTIEDWCGWLKPPPTEKDSDCSQEPIIESETQQQRPTPPDEPEIGQSSCLDPLERVKLGNEKQQKDSESDPQWDLRINTFKTEPDIDNGISGDACVKVETSLDEFSSEKIKRETDSGSETGSFLPNWDLQVNKIKLEPDPSFRVRADSEDNKHRIKKIKIEHEHNGCAKKVGLSPPSIGNLVANHRDSPEVFSNAVPSSNQNGEPQADCTAKIIDVNDVPPAQMLVQLPTDAVTNTACMSSDASLEKDPTELVLVQLFDDNPPNNVTTNNASTSGDSWEKDIIVTPHCTNDQSADSIQTASTSDVGYSAESDRELTGNSSEVTEDDQVTAAAIASLRQLMPAEGAKSHQCPICPVVLSGDDASQVFKHVAQIHMGKQVFQCRSCSYWTITRSLLTEHRRSSHRATTTTTNQPADQINDSDILQYRCTVCGQDFERISLLVEHSQWHLANDTPLPCPVCAAPLKTSKLLLVHLKRVHQQQGFACARCKTVALSEEALTQHTHETHPVSAGRCASCQLQTSRVALTDLFAMIKTKVLHYHCEQCPSSFAKETQLMVHRSAHLQESKLFNCQLCFQSFDTRPLLSEHESEVHKVSQHTCPWCSMVLVAAKEAVARHFASHLKEKLYDCNKCGYWTRYPDDLTEHKRKHQQLRLPYRCDVCGAGFHMAQQYVYHTNIKHAKQPYCCPWCNFESSVKSLVVCHLIDWHRGKLYCQCGRAATEENAVRVIES